MPKVRIIREDGETIIQGDTICEKASPEVCHKERPEIIDLMIHEAWHQGHQVVVEEA